MKKSPVIALLANLLLLLLCYGVVRVAFYLENRTLFDILSPDDIRGILRGGLRFDFGAIAYSNALYLLLLFLPFPCKEGIAWRRMLKVLFVVINSVCLASNLIDAVYYPFIKRRTTASVFHEFGLGDVADIIGLELVSHWYLTLLFVVLVGVMWKAYRDVVLSPTPHKRYFLNTAFAILCSAVAIVAGMRGGMDPEQRPLHNGMARQYVTQSAKAVLVQNTPFSIFRTLSKKSYPHYAYYAANELDAVFTPLRHAVTDMTYAPRRDNVVIIMLESFASEYSAHLNPYSHGEGYMPFLDSLMGESLTADIMMANGISSIDAQASVLASLPMMVESIMSSHATMNTFDGIGTYLKRLGYETAYFHGADNGSLSLDGFVKACGMDSYYGRNEYGDDSEWDHHWGIWDEPFLQFFAHKMNELREPFCTALFTLTSHHPFQIPQAYRDTFPEGQLPIYKSIRYADHALRRFFNTARQQPWFEHTLFIITGDHTNLQAFPEYVNEYGRFLVPVMFYHPTDTHFRGHRSGIFQQIDILPTVLHHVGFDGDYLAFGNDLLATPDGLTEAVDYINGLYQLTREQHLLQFDGERTVALYDILHDPQLKNNLVDKAETATLQQRMERRLKAMVQQYTTRMNENRTSVSPVNTRPE